MLLFRKQLYGLIHIMKCIWVNHFEAKQSFIIVFDDILTIHLAYNRAVTV